MGTAQSEISERNDEVGTGLHKKKVFANDGRICMEPARTGFNLGAGKIRWEGWTSVDVDGADINCDLRNIPVPDCSVDYATAIHVIEHFYAWEAPVVLKEWLRILKPGGTLVLELPSMKKVLGLIYKHIKNGVPIPSAISWGVFWGDPKYGTPAMCHKWGYTEEMIQELLQAVGFREVRFEKPFYHFPFRDMRVIGIK